MPTDSVTSLQLDPSISSSLSGGYEGIIVSADLSSTMAFQSSFNAENNYLSGYNNSGEIGQFQDQATLNSGATANGYVSFGSFPTLAGTCNGYTGFTSSANITGTLTGGISGFVTSIQMNTSFSGGVTAYNDFTNINSGSTISNYQSLQLNPSFNSGSSIADISGVNISPNLNGTVTAGWQGININPQGSANNFPNYFQGLNIDFSNFISYHLLPVGINVDQGIIQQNATLDTQFIIPSSVYGINNIGGEIHVSSGFPINGGQFGFGNNIGVALFAEDDILIDSSGADLGFSSVGFVTQVDIAASKTVATLNLMAAGAGIGGGSGNITNASMFRALGFLPEGGTLAITNLFGFKADPLLTAVGATNTWGYYENAGIQNAMSSLAISTSTQKVTNASVGLEIGSTTHALRLSQLTTTQRNALTALSGMEIYNTTTSQVEFYNGSAWTSSGSGAITSLTGAITGTGPGATVTTLVATTNSTLTTLSALSLPGSQVTGNISGNAANVTGTVAIANGGTGQTGATAAFNALAPSQTGNSGKFLTTNGTNTSWGTPAAAILAASIRDEKTVGTNGGTFTSGAWQTRDLNVSQDPNSIVTLSSNQFTLGAGTYMIDASAPADFVGSHQARLQNITDATTALVGTSSICGNTVVEDLTVSRIAGIFTIAGTKTFEIQHQCTSGGAGTYEFGRAAGFGTEAYTQLNLIKIA